MSENHDPKQAAIASYTAASDAGAQPRGSFRAVLYPHRSLGPTGFLVLMVAIGGVSFVTGMVFLMQGAWPVFGFFGLDVALVYAAFRLNYRAGRLYETVELTPQTLKITRVHPSGAQESFDFNPYWVRVFLAEGPQGRTDLRLASHGREFAFARFLTDDERRELSHALSGALARARTAQP
ncbi:MAG: DUF2244 domain-containing protein [Hyphomicrobium sp.]